MATKHYALSAAKREKAGKGASRVLRRENRVPAVIYGDNKEPVKISLNNKDITLEFHKGHMFTTLCDIDVEGAKQMVLARDVQLHPVTDRVEHVDFIRVTAKTKIAIQVPVHFINQDKCPGLSEKGVLNVVRHEIELMCTATDIPDHIDVDLTDIKIGDAIKVSRAKLPAGATPTITGRDFTIATMIMPKAFVEEEIKPAEAMEGAEGAAAPAEGAAAAPSTGASASATDAKGKAEPKGK